jgi:cytochrome c oxidase subunit II
VLRRIFSTDHDIIATNRMNLPVRKPVVIFLSSTDVIHSFGLPQMRVKQDAIPGIVQPVWFTPTKVGQWDVARSVWMPRTRTPHAEAC